MQHDVQLRADARVAYEKISLWEDQPRFSVAEQWRTELYRKAVTIAQEDRALDREVAAIENQLRLAV